MEEVTLRWYTVVPRSGSGHRGSSRLVKPVSAIRVVSPVPHSKVGVLVLTSPDPILTLSRKGTFYDTSPGNPVRGRHPLGPPPVSTGSSLSSRVDLSTRVVLPVPAEAGKVAVPGTAKITSRDRPRTKQGAVSLVRLLQSSSGLFCFISFFVTLCM